MSVCHKGQEQMTDNREYAQVGKDKGQDEPEPRPDPVRSQPWLSAILGASRDGIAVEESERIVYANHAFARLYGYDDPTDLLGRHVSNFRIPEDSERMLDYGRRRLRGESAPAVYEFQAVRKDATRIDLEASVSTAIIAGKHYIIAVVRDITERKQMEGALRDSEERFRQLAENILEVFWMIEPEGRPPHRVLYVSPAYEEIWGRSCQSLYDNPMSFLEAIHPDDRERIRTLVESHATPEEGMKYRIVRPDGSVRWIWDHVFPILDAQGKLYRLVGIAQDITERKHAEGAVRESERHFHTLAEIVPVGIFRADAAGKCVFMNQRAFEMAGLSPDEQLDYCWQRALHPGDRARVLAEWMKAAQNNEPFRTQCRFRHRDGTIRWILSQGLAERDETGGIVGYVGSLTDITEQREAQLRLAESERLAALGCMIAGIAHELNNPLQVILGFSELLRQNPNLDATQRHQAEIIQNQSARARKIISNLLTFGRQNALEPTRVNINQLLQKLLELRGYALHLDGIQLETEFQSLPMILADPNRLQQVFLNLFLNAEQAVAQATGERKIALRTRLDHTPAGEQIRVTLSDTGVGIPREHLPRVFDPFFTTKPPGEGTGLGLSIAYSIVREHGGSIELASEVGLGTTVTVSLPVVPAESAANPKPEPPPPPSLPPACEQRPRSALVVDDEEAIREFLQESLRLEGFEVDIAENAAQGLARLRACHYDLVLCDIKMPGKTGIELLEEISREQPDIVSRFIFMTGDALSPGTREVLDSAVVRYLMKPFTLADVLRLLSEPS